MKCYAYVFLYRAGIYKCRTWVVEYKHHMSGDIQPVVLQISTQIHNRILVVSRFVFFEKDFFFAHDLAEI